MTTPAPKPTPPTPIRKDEWHEVRCPHCGKLREEAKPGSEIRWRCTNRDCREWVSVKIAA